MMPIKEEVGFVQKMKQNKIIESEEDESEPEMKRGNLRNRKQYKIESSQSDNDKYNELDVVAAPSKISLQDAINMTS